MLKRNPRRSRNVTQRTKNNIPPPPNVNVASATHGTSEVTIVFDGPVQIAAGVVPTTWSFGAPPRAITGVVSNTATSYVFALNGTVAASDPYSIPANDPAVRTSGGGYVNGKVGTLI